MIMKKKNLSFLVKIMLVALLITPPLLGSTSFLGFNKSSNVAHAAEKRVVVGSYTLSKAQTKNLANNMKAIKGNSNLKIAILAVATKWGGVAGWASALAVQLSSNAVYKKEVINAAKKGKRLKITITDYKNYHTSYSAQIKYTIVK
ncbi:hypothetical protein MOD48_09540 [Bacillus spizizenii]|nr:hypothetical protein [Bacillus spizizenii]MCY8168329.1 hypothetical protein [Bacillus spizizenii]MCY8230029.1 hypothetical protein [Bacillus spizizenii]MCY8314916.1 hypothetical protein [Bacillus spizizenii]MCY8677114.1 hypothetical protein [Bacillus spizizenii]